MCVDADGGYPWQRSETATAWEPQNLASAWAALLGRIATEIPNAHKTDQFYEAMNDMSRFVDRYETETQRRERAPMADRCPGCGEVWHDRAGIAVVRENEALRKVAEAARAAFNFLVIDEEHPNRVYHGRLGEALDALDAAPCASATEQTPVASTGSDAGTSLVGRRAPPETRVGDAIGRHPGEPSSETARAPDGGDPGVAGSTPALPTTPNACPDPLAANPGKWPCKCGRCIEDCPCFASGAEANERNRAEPSSGIPRGSKLHRLKTHTPVFRDVVEDRKPFEIRKNDRDFQVGDVLRLEEWNPDTGYTDAYTHWKVTYLVQGVYGLPADVCVMAIEPAFHVDITLAIDDERGPAKASTGKGGA